MVYRYADHNSASRGIDLTLGQRFITYPTFLSEDQEDDHTTGENGVLYFATRVIGADDSRHNLTSVDIQLAA